MLKSTKTKRKKRTNPFSFNFLFNEIKNEAEKVQTTEDAQFSLFNSNYVADVKSATQISLFDSLTLESSSNESSEVNTLFDLFGNVSDTNSTALTESEKKQSSNYKITDYDIGSGTPTEKFKRNIEAIKVLKSIESDGREATADEQAVMAQYVGWGGLSTCFKDGSDTDNELQKTLTESEYRAARASILTAYYTPPVVIEKIYEFFKSCNLTKANILEPCCGIGNFFGMLPKSMTDSRLYGVELDSISARIAEYLYPDAKIQNCGFEKTKFHDNYFDVAIGNVPFGEYGVADIRYDHMNLLIHDYFFIKTIDLVRPGGVIAFITSKGTMDKKNSKIREYIAQRCDLLGAVRLPNTTFKANAGTTVTSDIIFLKKRESITTEKPEWVETEFFNEEILYNKYFHNNPEMVLGEFKVVSTPHGKNDISVSLKDGSSLKDELSEAIKNIDSADLTFCGNAEDDVEEILADDEARNFSYHIHNGELYYRKNSLMEKAKVSKSSEKRIRAMIELRDIVYQLLTKQQDENADITKLQKKLNSIYDLFVVKNGRICDKANNVAFRADNSMPLLRSLEVYDNKGNFVRKADIFSKRTLLPNVIITHCESATDALGVSLAKKGNVNFEYMTELTGLSRAELLRELDGQIFAEPHKVNEKGEYIYSPADEYLSGNVVEKLEVAEKFAENDKNFLSNVEALKKVQPVPLEATDIDIKLGAVWIKTDYYNHFIYELLKIPRYNQKEFNRYSENYLGVDFCKETASFNIRNKNHCKWNTLATSEYGTERKNAISIIEDSLNQRSTKVFDSVEDENGKKKSVLNEKETQLAQTKQEIIKQRFKDWLYENADRRNDIVATYNKLFNCIRPREYDGSHLTFSGMNPNIQFYDYQKNAVARSVYGGNALFAHCVGAGKSYEMIASIMEGKKLGKNTKALVVVPNHLTEQFGNDFLTLYPSANILVATKKDFSLKKRQELVSRISTSNFDAVIIGHSQLLKVALSPQYTERCIENEIAELAYALSQLDDDGKGYSARQIEGAIKKLETRLEKIQEHIKDRTDDVIIFEQLGIDKLVLDEAHYFKNLQVPTKMNGVSGVNTSGSQKASDLYYKCQYLNELTDYKGLIFATGTPVSNTMTEIFTMQKYLQSDVLDDMGLGFFDAWAAQFGEVVSQFELAPEGTGFRMKERFAKFYNLPELMNIFKLVADIKTSVDVKLDVPDCEMINVICEPTEIQKDYVLELSKRASDIHAGGVDPSEDNMLKITSDGRKCGLDFRLINPFAPDEPTSKLNSCVNNIFKIWNDTKDEKLTQLVFCDMSTPKADEKIDNPDFTNIYNDVKKKLMNLGVPSEEIAFIHDYADDDKKEECFAEVREGNIRILLGSTNKLGVGTNVQTRLIALHDLDIPWRPSDLEQRLGRMVRQGNRNEKVFLYRYTTKGTFDAYLYQILEAKQRFISQIMSSDNPVRTCDNVDEVTLSFAEVKALCSGNPLIKEKLELDVDVKKLQLVKSSWKSTKYRLENELVTTLPGLLSKYRWNIENIRKDIDFINNHYSHLLKKESEEDDDNTDEKKEDNSPFEMVIEGVSYTKRSDAAAAFQKALAHISYDDLKSFDYNQIGEYMGMPISVRYEQAYSTYNARLKGNHYYTFELGASSLGAIRRIENRGKTVEKLLTLFENKLNEAEMQIKQTKNVLAHSYTVFPQQEELEKKEARLRELNAELSLDKTAA